MNNANAYLILFPQGVGATRQEFQTLFNQVTNKTQVIPNVYLVHSTTDLTAWYQAVGTDTGGAGTTGTTGAIGLTAPVVLPVALDQLKGVRGLPSTLLTMINQYAQAA